jgi:hypothetical protein
MPENEKAATAGSDEAQQDVAQASDAKAEATGTASDELSEDDLNAVAGGTSTIAAEQQKAIQSLLR